MTDVIAIGVSVSVFARPQLAKWEHAQSISPGYTLLVEGLYSAPGNFRIRPIGMRPSGKPGFAFSSLGYSLPRGRDGGRRRHVLHEGGPRLAICFNRHLLEWAKLDNRSPRWVRQLAPSAIGRSQRSFVYTQDDKRNDTTALERR